MKNIRRGLNVIDIFGKHSLLFNYPKKHQSTSFWVKGLPNMSPVTLYRRQKEILNYIDKENIDLVIMGTGRGLHKAIFGSVTDKVAKLAKVPVMLLQTA